MLIKDCYPEKLLNEWEIWKNKHKCENDCPGMFIDTIVYCVTTGHNTETTVFVGLRPVSTWIQKRACAMQFMDKIRNTL